MSRRIYKLRLSDAIIHLSMAKFCHYSEQQVGRELQHLFAVNIQKIPRASQRGITCQELNVHVNNNLNGN